MNQLIRFEDLTNNRGIDKVFVFEPSIGLKAYESAIQLREGATLDEIGMALGEEFAINSTGSRIVRNPFVLNAYTAPLKVYIDLTTLCDDACGYCCAAANLTDVHLPVSILTKLAREMYELGVMYIKLGGGNPLLYPDVLDVLRLFHEDAGCIVSMSVSCSEALLELDPRVIDAFLKYHVRVRVSLEGMSETDAGLRNPGHFKRALAVLREYREAGIDVTPRITLMPANLHDVEPLFNFVVHNLGMKLKVNNCRAAGRAVTNGHLLTLAYAKQYMDVIRFLNRPEILPYVIIDDAMRMHQSRRIRIGPLDQGVCGARGRSMNISPAGIVSPCSFLRNGFASGKIYQNGSLLDFWSGKVGRLALARSIQIPDACIACNRFCKGGCQANQIHSGGDDPTCMVVAQRNIV